MESISVIVGGSREEKPDSFSDVLPNNKFNEEAVMTSFDANCINPSSSTSLTSLTSEKRSNAICKNNLLQVPIRTDKVIKSEQIEKVVSSVTDVQMKRILEIVKQPEFQRVCNVGKVNDKAHVQQKASEPTKHKKQTPTITKSNSPPRRHSKSHGKRKSPSPTKLLRSYRDSNCEGRSSATKNSRAEDERKSTTTKNSKEEDKRKSSTTKNSKEEDERKSSITKNSKEEDKRKSSTTKNIKKEDQKKSSTTKNNKEEDETKSSTTKNSKEEDKRKSSTTKNSKKEDETKSSTTKNSKEGDKRKSSTTKNSKEEDKRKSSATKKHIEEDERKSSTKNGKEEDQRKSSAQKERPKPKSPQRGERYNRKHKLDTKTNRNHNRHKMSENSTGVKPRSESRHKNSKSSTSVNVPASSYKSARNDTKTSPKSRKKDTTENTFARERVEQDKTSLKEKVETEILPDSTTSPADNNAPRQASPMKDTLDKLVNVIQALLNQGSSNGTEKDNKKVMSPTLETNRSTTFHVNFDVSSPKVEPSNALKLPGNFQPTFSSLLLPDVDECYSPTSSYSPCSDTEKVPLADSERTKENIPNWPKDTNMLNSDQKSSGFSEASCSEQTKEQHITTNLPSNIEMSFWPSSPIRIEFIENDTVEAILKAPVCQKCICDNAHLNGIKDPRSQNQKYIRYFTLWHMCCLCLESKGATEKFRMCTLPDSISGPTSNISKLINEEALPPKDTVVHEQIPKLQSINTHQSLLQTECLRIKAMTEEQTNNNQKVDEKKNDCITLSRSKTASTSAAGTSESGNQNFSGSERTLTSIPFTSDNIQHSEIPTTSYEQDTPYYYNINYFNEKKTSICEYESPTEEETFIPPEPSTPTGSDEDLPKKESQDPQEIIPAAVDEVTKVTQLQEIESGSISPPVTKSMLDQNSKLLNSNKPTGNNLLVSAIHQAVTSKSSSNLCKSLSSGASGSYKHYPVHTSSETAAESSDDPVSCLFGHFQGYAPSLLNNLPESSSSNTQNNESSSSDGPSLKPWSRKRNLAKLVYSDLSSDSDGERANKRKFEITKTTRTVEMASTKTGLKPNFTPSKSNSTEKLVLVEKNNSATNPPQLSSFAAHDATSEKLKPNTAKSIFSETSDIFDSTANEETDYQPVHTESSHDWSNPEWLDVEIPQLSRPKRRRTTFKNKSRETDTKQLKAKTCVARSQSTSESTKTNLTDRKVPFKKRRFSDLSVEKPLQEWITDADQWQSPATKTRLDLNQAKQNVRNDDNDRGGKSNKTSDQTTTKGVDDQISVCTSEPEITAESEAFAQETMDDECTDSSSTKTVSTETEQNETFTLAQPCIAECKHFYVKGKPYAWPYTYPTLSQIDALSDSDDSEKYTSAHFYKPYIFLKRLEEDGYVPECFVKDMAHHQCCLCCTSYCCSTPWVSIENVKLVD